MLFKDALNGFKTEITQLDGRKIIIERDAITGPGVKIRKKGEGMPNYENNNLHGNLIITIDVQFPQNIFNKQDKEGKYYIICYYVYENLNFNLC